jgi:hypothetical protein
MKSVHRVPVLPLPGSYTAMILETGQPKKCKRNLVDFVPILFHAPPPNLLILRQVYTFSTCGHLNDWVQFRFGHDRRSNPLLAAQIAFRRLNGNMPQKELDLF